MGENYPPSKISINFKNNCTMSSFLRANDNAR